MWRPAAALPFFLGEETRSDFVNKELYRDGKGLFPVPLGSPTELLVDRLEKTPDVQGEEHFLFRYLGNRNEHLGAVSVQRYFSIANTWNPKNDTSVHVIMRLRGGSPLMVERGFRQGSRRGLPLHGRAALEQLGLEQRNGLVPRGHSRV